LEGETLEATSPATASWEEDADELELDERVDVAAAHADDFPATVRGDEGGGAASAAPEPGFAAHDVPEPAMARATMESGAVGMRHAERRERHERSETPEMTSEELSATSKSLTEELLRAMGFEPRVSVRAEGNRVDVTVEVDRDDELLNGRQGETRQALQHLLNRFLNKGDGSRYHLQLEVNDFWQRREAELAELARRLAEEAVTNNAEVVSDYLNSQERRIVHVTLREDGRVKTFSLGDGMMKRVAVAPAGFPERTGDDTES
jgi:spoIIIJ-associated protein